MRAWQRPRQKKRRALEKLAIFLLESIQLFAFNVENTSDAVVFVNNRHNDFRLRAAECRQVARVFMHIADDDRLARFSRRTTKSLRDRKSRISHRAIPGSGENDKFGLGRFINT